MWLNFYKRVDVCQQAWGGQSYIICYVQCPGFVCLLGFGCISWIRWKVNKLWFSISFLSWTFFFFLHAVWIQTLSLLLLMTLTKKTIMIMLIMENYFLPLSFLTHPPYLSISISHPTSVSFWTCCLMRFQYVYLLWADSLVQNKEKITLHNTFENAALNLHTIYPNDNVYSAVSSTQSSDDYIFSVSISMLTFNCSKRLRIRHILINRLNQLRVKATWCSNYNGVYFCWSSASIMHFNFPPPVSLSLVWLTACAPEWTKS